MAGLLAARLLVIGATAPLLGVMLTSCETAAPGQAQLRPTLEVRQVEGGQAAFQAGLPMPTFSFQPRQRVSLDGSWRFQPQAFDSDVSLADRSSVSRALIQAAGARLRDDFDDSSWTAVSVPGTFSAPPDGRAVSGWYRLRFRAPELLDGLATLKFLSVGYVADVWLNGRYLGYHEGAWTPFALDASEAVRAGAVNTLVVRVDNPAWGTRLDIVPWGLTDWWSYGGITGSVWLEAVPEISVVRADVTPHLDGADVSVVVQNRGLDADEIHLTVEVLPAAVTEANVADPDPRSLVPARATPIFSQVLGLDPLSSTAVRRVGAAFVMRFADHWSPASPALYVLRVALHSGGIPTDEVYETFGLRQVRVDASAPRILLNGEPVAFHGVALHDEKVSPAVEDRPAGGLLRDPLDALDQLRRARDVNADFIRADHHPANPLLLTLADRIGFAVWEEIPLYHFTPQTFQIAMRRGIAQQMLSEMILRDMNHPSVLFHGFANESTGQQERTAALAALHQLDRRLDGTRLTGQAAYGSDPDDPTSGPLDVAGCTLYYGVFYGGPLDAATVGAALDRIHARHPRKPVLVLEFGRWADSVQEEAEQVRVFSVTYPELSRRFGTLANGFVGAAVWWTLDDYWTQRPGLQVEHFGLYRPGGTVRPAGNTAAEAFRVEAIAGERPPGRRIVSGGQAMPAGRTGAGRQFVLLLLYALALPAAGLGGLVILLLRGGRGRGSSSPARTAP